MDAAALPPLSFAAIEARIRAMPQGPIAVLDTPRWAMRLYVVAAAAAICGLVPSLLLYFMEPQPWMAVMARGGVIAMVCACALPFVHSLWVLWRQLLRPRQSMIEQMDHERLMFAELAHWLARYPKPVVADHLRFAQNMQSILQAKLSLLVGSIDKLGVVPAIVSGAIALNAGLSASRPPLWLVIVGISLALLWIVCVSIAFARVRVQQFEALLGSAVKLQEADQKQGAPYVAAGHDDVATSG